MQARGREFASFTRLTRNCSFPQFTVADSTGADVTIFPAQSIQACERNSWTERVNKPSSGLLLVALALLTKSSSGQDEASHSTVAPAEKLRENWV